MKKWKKLAALAVACIMALGSVTTVFAQESLTTTLYQKGSEYLLVGKGAQENSIVINLGGKSEVTTTYYAASPMMMEKPDYRVEVEDLPDDDEAEIKVIYNETLNMYGVQITAKDLSNSDFMIRYLKKTGSNYQAIAQTNIKLMIIDGDDYVSDEEISDERYSDLRSQAGSTNVLEGLESCADGQSIVVDISDTNRISNAWLKTLRQYPKKTLVCTGEDYSWTIKGSDVGGNSGYLSHYMGVSTVASNQKELEQAMGITGVCPVVISGMRMFPATATLTVHMAGQSYKNTKANVYRYENGKLTVVQENVMTDANGNLTFPVSSGGTYIVSRNKSRNAQ